MTIFVFDNELKNSYRLLLKQYTFELSDRIKRLGVAETIKVFKEDKYRIYNFINISTFGGDIFPFNSNELPKWLYDQRHLINSTWGLRYVNTLLSTTRCFKLPVVLDTKSITEPSIIVDDISDHEIKLALRQLGCERINVEWKEIHFSTKSGPIGHATLSCIDDWNHLSIDQLSKILILGGNSFRSYLNKLLDPIKGHNLMDVLYSGNKKTITRKLSLISDKEGKTRTIAIFDYWSQSVLKPLHDKIMSCLKRIKNDCTFDQSKYSNLLPKVGPYFSVDMSNATDRFPLSFQKRVLKSMTNDNYAEAWSSLLVNYPMEYKGVFYKYAVGQPMGAYSSFPMFALCHHVVVRISANRVGVKSPRYCLLGDDIVLTNLSLKNEYIKILNNFKVEISEKKSYSGHLYEFAKRIHINNQEVTGFQISGIVENWKSIVDLFGILTNNSLSIYFETMSRRSEFVYSMYKYMGWRNSRYWEYASNHILKMGDISHFLTSTCLWEQISSDPKFLIS